MKYLPLAVVLSLSLIACGERPTELLNPNQAGDYIEIQQANLFEELERMDKIEEACNQLKNQNPKFEIAAVRVDRRGSIQKIASGPEASSTNRSDSPTNTIGLITQLNAEDISGPRSPNTESFKFLYSSSTLSTFGDDVYEMQAIVDFPHGGKFMNMSTSYLKDKSVGTLVFSYTEYVKTNKYKFKVYEALLDTHCR